MAASLAIAVVALAGAAIAAQRSSVDASRIAPALPAGSGAAIQAAVESKIATLHGFDKAIGARAAAAAKKAKSRSFTIPLGGAVDGDHLYWSRVIVTPHPGNRYGEDFGVRSQVFRTDRTGGTDTKLLDKQNAFTTGIAAAGGRVVLETFTTGDHGTRSKIAIYAGAASDASLKAIDVLGFDDGSDGDCDHFKVVDGIAPNGDPLVVEVVPTCHHGEASSMTATLQRWTSDGSRIDLGPAPAESVYGFTLDAQMNGTSIVESSPFENSTVRLDAETGAIANIWTPGSKTAAIADDGTIALIGRPPDRQQGTFNGSYIEGSSSSSATFSANAAGDSAAAAKARKTRPKQPAEKSPFVIFPGGNSDQPKLIAASRSRVEQLKICGPNLYAVESADPFGGALDELSEYFLALIPGLIPRERMISLYTIQGDFIKKVGKTEAYGVAAYGCSGPDLALGVVHGETVRESVIAP